MLLCGIPEAALGHGAQQFEPIKSAMRDKAAVRSLAV